MRMRSRLLILTALGTLTVVSAARADDTPRTPPPSMLPAIVAMPEPSAAPATEPAASVRETDGMGRADHAAGRPAAPAVDGVDSERETLARIASELLLLQGNVRAAARGAPTMTRVQFRYDWLEADLELIERGIRDHLDAPRQPRAVVPLKGDYRR